MAENDLKVIVKAKELAVHSFKLTSNCNRYGAWKNHISHGNCCKLGRAMDERVRTIIGQAQGITGPRLIDANALLDKFWKPECRTQTRRDFCAMVNYAPTVDAVEVLHGRWVEVPSMAPEYQCSNCGQTFEWWERSEAHYCPPLRCKDGFERGIVMCEKCKELVMCPVGEKRRVEVAYPDKGETVDAYGKKLFIAPWVMFVDRWPDGKTDSGLYQEVYDENSVHYGGGLAITHCPFCGEKFA